MRDAALTCLRAPSLSVLSSRRVRKTVLVWFYHIPAIPLSQFRSTHNKYIYIIVTPYMKTQSSHTGQHCRAKLLRNFRMAVPQALACQMHTTTRVSFKSILPILKINFVTAHPTQYLLDSCWSSVSNIPWLTSQIRNLQCRHQFGRIVDSDIIYVTGPRSDLVLFQ